ncbi:hypothetical protein L7F22_010580 [Adiantum nelumboides]|nr:hypothetical protein [Adiantum nelumboides]
MTGDLTLWISNPGGSRRSNKLEEGIDPSITESALAIQSAFDIPPPHSLDDELLEWLVATDEISSYGIIVQQPCGKPEPDGLFSPSIQISKSTKASQSSEQMSLIRFLPIMAEVKSSLVVTSSQVTGVPNLCSQEITDSASHRSWGCMIPLVEGTRPVRGRAYKLNPKGESETTVIIATELLEEVANSLICRLHDAHKNLHFWKARAEGAHMQKVRFMVLERGPLAFVQGIAKLVRDCIKEHSPTQGLAAIAASQISERTVLLHALESRLAIVLGEADRFGESVLKGQPEALSVALCSLHTALLTMEGQYALNQSSYSGKIEEEEVETILSITLQFNNLPEGLSTKTNWTDAECLSCAELIRENLKRLEDCLDKISPNDIGQAEEQKQKKSSSSSTTAITEEELPTMDKIYEGTSSEEVDTNYAAETSNEKEVEAMARRKIGMPNWLLLDDQEIEEWNLGSEQDPKMIKINKHLKKELKDGLEFILEAQRCFCMGTHRSERDRSRSLPT